MKQLKFLTMALAMMLGLTMTSCLDTETDPTQTAYTIAKVQDSGLYGTTFVTPGGQRITPTTESVLNYTANTQVSMSSINGQIVQVLFSWNSDVLNPDFNAQNITGVDLGNVQSLENPTLVVQGANKGVAGRDSVATHAITSLNPKISDSYKYQPYFFDDTRNLIVLPVNYFLTSQAMIGTSCTLVYYPDDPDTQTDKANGIMRLYLNYRANGLFPSAQYSSMGYWYYYTNNMSFCFKAYDLSDYTRGQSILQAWGSSIAPENINIVVSENEYSADLSNSKQAVYPVVTFEEYQRGIGATL